MQQCLILTLVRRTLDFDCGALSGRGWSTVSLSVKLALHFPVIFNDDK